MAALDEDVQGYEDWRALCGGDGDGLSVINEVLLYYFVVSFRAVSTQVCMHSAVVAASMTAH
jgi:hypothetical protein